MDFPLRLLDSSHVIGMKEFKQDIEILLKNQIGTFMQSPLLGSQFDIHASEDLIEEGVKQTLTQLKGVSVESIKISLPNVTVSVSYYDEIVNFNFRIQDENQE